MSDPVVTFVSDSFRYELTVDGEVAGFIAVDERDGALRFVHTEVNDAYQGQGLAPILAGRALADAAERGVSVVPVCPYIARYVRRNEVPGLTVVWPSADA